MQLGVDVAAFAEVAPAKVTTTDRAIIFMIHRLPGISGLLS